MIRRGWAACAALLLALIAVMPLSIVVATPAAADEASCIANGGTWTNVGGGRCRENLDIGGTVPAGDEVTIPVNRGYGGEPPKCFRDVAGQRQQIDCVSEHGVWNGYCYVQHVPERPAGNIEASRYREAKKGHEGGAIIGCWSPPCDGPVFERPDGAAFPCPSYRWAPDADPVDPAEVAQEILASLGKRSVDIGVAPYDKPGHVGYVGLGTWYWLEDRSKQVAGPLTETDSSHGFTVEVDAHVDRVEWQLGDVKTLECPVDSMPFVEGQGLGDQYPEGSPDCGYVFQEQGEFQIRATSVWVDSWSGLGRVGTEENPLGGASTTIRIGENQALRQ